MSKASTTAQTTGTPEGGRLTLVLIYVATRWTSYLSFQALPLIIGALVAGFSLSPPVAGTLAGIELVALAVTAQLATRSAVSVGVVGLGAVGAGLAASAQMLTAAVSGLIAIGTCRIVSGIGTGLLAAAANASLSARPQPERWFARIGAVGSAVGALVLGGLPPLAQRAGQRSVFVALGAGMIIALLCTRGLPPAVGAAVRSASQGAARFGRNAWILLSGVALFSLGQGAIWSFAERLAVAIGVRPDRLGLWFLMGSLVGIAGSLAAGWSATRFARTPPVLLGVLTAGGSCLFLSHAPSELSFAALLLVYFFALQFVFPLLFGLSAVLDTSGTLVTATTNVLLLTSAAAPIIGGVLLVKGGFPSVGWLAIACCTAAAALFALVTRGLHGKSEAGLAHDG